MRTVKGVGLWSAVLTLLHGLYIPLLFLWVFVLILVGLERQAPPFPNPLALAILDTAVYLFLGVGMLRGRRSYFVYAAVWTIWGAVLATLVATYKGSIANLLSFLIVFFCTYYHVSVNKTNVDVAKILRQIAGVLALVQGIIVTLAFVFAYILHLRVWIILLPSLDQLISLNPAFMAAAIVTAIAYLVMGAGMLMGRKDFFLLAIFWTIVESALTVANSSYTRTHINIISMLILAFATYYYQRP